jgi:predicted MFS family arabinose efflux permease
MKSQPGAKEEWRKYWYLPLVAGLGYSTAVMHTYGLGPFIAPLQQEFGWSRASISFGLTIVGLTGACLGIPMGLLVDRLGPRRIALTGVVLGPATIALLGTATGTLANWYALWALLAVCNLALQATVWTSAVASRFEASRGMAFAVSLSGASISAVLLPAIATAVIIAYDWRTAFITIGLLWMAVVFPLMFLFFRGAQDERRTADPATRKPAAVLTGATVGEALRSAAFYQIMLAALLFTFTAVGTIVHFVPILTDRGASPLGAAGVASIVGVFSIIGRLGTGFLLDRFPAGLVGAASFLLPVASCLLLLLDGANPVSQTIAAALFGFTVGAEVDVIAYLATRQFGLKSYGTIFGSIVTAMAAGTALGPLAAGAAYDFFDGYSQFLLLTAAMMGVSAVAVATIRSQRIGADAAREFSH